MECIHSWEYGRVDLTLLYVKRNDDDREESFFDRTCQHCGKVQMITMRKKTKWRWLKQIKADYPVTVSKDFYFSSDHAGFIGDQGRAVLIDNFRKLLRQLYEQGNRQVVIFKEEFVERIVEEEL